MAANSFSLDLGEKLIRMADNDFTNGKIVIRSLGVEHAMETFYTDDIEKTVEKQAEIIAKMHADLKIPSRSVNVILPDTYSFSQIVEFSKLNEKELLSAVRYQADQFIPLPIDEVVLDIEILKEDKENKKNTVLIVATPKKIVDRIEKAVEYAGLVPNCLENELCGVGRIFSEIIKPSLNAYIVVNFGYTSTSIYLMDGVNSTILASRTIKLGFNLFIKELKFNLEMQDTKVNEILNTIGLEQNASYDISSIVAPILRDLLNEISKFVLLSKEKYQLSVEKIYLYNYSSYVLSFEKKIFETLSVPTEQTVLADLLETNPIVQSFSHEIPSFISAISGNIK